MKLTKIILSVLLLTGSQAISGNEGTEPVNKNSDSKNKDTPLTPVIVGALIAFVGSIGGGAGVFLLQSHNERKIFKRTKLEEITALACQCDDWLDQLLLSYLVQGDINAIIEKYPVSRMKMIQVLYFPILKNEVEAVSNSVKDFRKLAISERKHLQKTQKYSPNFKEQYYPKQKEVLESIKQLLKKAAAIQC